MDEVRFQQHGSRCRMWVPPEVKEPILLHSPTRKSVGYFGAVRLRDGKFSFRREESKFNAESFLGFRNDLFQPEDILEKYRGPEDENLIADTGAFLGTRYPRQTARNWYENSYRRRNTRAQIGRLLFLCPADPGCPQGYMQIARITMA